MTSAVPEADRYQAAVADIAQAATPDALESAVGDYLMAAAALETATADDESRSAALIAGDLRVLALLARLDSPEDEQPVALSADGQARLSQDFAADMSLVVGGIGGQPAPPGDDDLAWVTLAEESPDVVAGHAIDAIVAEGTQVVGKVIAAFVVPTGAELTAVAQAFGGKTGADLAQRAIGAVNWAARKVKQAIARVLAALLDRLTRFVGGTTAQGILDQAKDWLADVVKKINPLTLLLGVSVLKSDVTAQLAVEPGTAAARAKRAADLVGQHAHAQRWIGWGAGILAVVDHLHLDKAVPWGTALTCGTGAVLLAVCVWMVNDYLDARNWPLSRVAGVRTVVRS